jgi:hypothetical protein
MAPETANVMSGSASISARTRLKPPPTGPSLGVRRRVRRFARELWFKAFLLFEKIGVHVLPKSFYSPVQDYRWLEEHKAFWADPSPLIGIDWDVEQQLAWLNETCAPYYPEVSGLGFFNESAAREWGPGFGPIESQVLHCFIRSKAPARVIEIGSGQSTVCMLHASQLNAREGRPASQITCIEPFPRKTLRHLDGISLLEQPCQTVPITVYSQLHAGDLLFIDSSHAVKVGSDVIRIFLEIIPSLPAGVFIHIHDINFPYLYNRSTLSPYFMQNSQETALLAALLTENKHLAVLGSLSALHYDRTHEMKSLLNDYEPQANINGLCPAYPPKGHAPNSIWLETR